MSTVHFHLPNAGLTFRICDEIAARRASHHAAAQDTEDGLIDCADGSIDLDRRLRELTLMLGSVATGVESLENAPDGSSPLVREEIRSDLIGLAAVAVAIAESLTSEEGE